MSDENRVKMVFQSFVIVLSELKSTLSSTPGLFLGIHCCANERNRKGLPTGSSVIPGRKDQKCNGIV